MSGQPGFGDHHVHCTMVHYEGGGLLYHYCLVCRTPRPCFAFPNDCGVPRARVSEEDSRDARLRVGCPHTESMWRHYQVPYFVPTDDYWDNCVGRFDFCSGCNACTGVCDDNEGMRCRLSHSFEPPDDRYLIRIAWVASQVEGDPP